MMLSRKVCNYFYCIKVLVDEYQKFVFLCKLCIANSILF